MDLTNSQKEIIGIFYSNKKSKVVIDKKERDKIWNNVIKHKDLDLNILSTKSKALVNQIQRSFDSGNNIQSAVFSECVYAQTIANMLGLDIYNDCVKNPNCLSNDVINLLNENNLVPRYSYSNDKYILIQAGGCGGVDCTLIDKNNNKIYLIEFKESYAKTSEPDLPKYGEDGVLIITEDFIKNYPQFEQMLNEHKGLNLFGEMGHNINDFSKQSVSYAVSKNYNSKKFADIICTEDSNGYLVAIPANEIHLWSEMEGEIRPAGRNHSNVWTINALRNFLADSKIDGDTVTVEKSKLEPRIERGSDKKISGYKINSLFFIYTKDCIFDNENLIFDIKKVQQLRPTLSAKMSFKKVKYDSLQEYYKFT